MKTIHVSHPMSWSRMLYGHLKNITFDHHKQLAVYSQADAGKNTKINSVILNKNGSLLE
jgi:hypothetical protein